VNTVVTLLLIIVATLLVVALFVAGSGEAGRLRGRPRTSLGRSCRPRPQWRRAQLGHSGESSRTRTNCKLIRNCGPARSTDPSRI
jgi:hypothetical protein